MCTPEINKSGANPANLQWTVIRGDTASIRVDFLENDEVTYLDTTGWQYKATAHDPSGDFLDLLDVEPSPGYVTIIAGSCLTKNWGTSYKSVVAELPFDLEVTIPETPNDRVWTPIIGTICVLGDVSPGGSL